MKFLHLLALISLTSSTLACKKLTDQRINTGALRTQGKVEGATAEEPKPAPKQAEPIKTPDALLGLWATPCGTLNNANKNQMEVFARQTYEFLASGRLLQETLVFTDDACATVASEAMVKEYFSGFDLPAEDVDKAVKAVLTAKEEKSFLIAALSDNGAIEINIRGADGIILYTSIALKDNQLMIARECLPAMIEKAQCTNVSGDNATHRAKNMDSINTYERLQR